MSLLGIGELIWLFNMTLTQMNVYIQVGGCPNYETFGAIRYPDRLLTRVAVREVSRSLLERRATCITKLGYGEVH